MIEFSQLNLYQNVRVGRSLQFIPRKNVPTHIHILMRVACVAFLSLLAPHGIAAISKAPLVQPNVPLFTNGFVTASGVAPDGSVIIGGGFTSINGVPRQNIAKLHADGSLDLDWNPGTDNDLWAVAIDTEGSVYVGGWFTTIGGQSRPGIAKLSLTGSGTVDTTWSPTVLNPAHGSVYALAVDANHNVFVGGNFSSMNGQANLTKLVAGGHGTSDASWAPAPNDAVTAIALVPSGSIYIGGNFTRVGGAIHQRLAKIATSGTNVVDENWVPYANANVRALAVLSDGSVMAGGYFTMVNGISRPNLVKLDGHGSGLLDSTWDAKLTDAVFSIATTPSDDLYIGGDFFGLGGVGDLYVARLASAGHGAVDPNWAANADLEVDTVSVNAQGNVFIGGYFRTVGTHARQGLAIVSSNAQALPAMDAEIPGIAWALAKQPNGGTIVGGQFSRAGSVPRGNLLRLQPDGTLDLEWNPSVSYGEVMALATNSVGDVYAAGSFQAVNGGYVAAPIVKLDGSSIGTPVMYVPYMHGWIYALALGSDDALYAGGTWTDLNNQNHTLGKFNAYSGAIDSSWTLDTDNWIFAMAADASGHLYIGGNFWHSREWCGILLIR